MSTSSFVVGLDLGGTNIKAVLMDCAAHVLADHTTPTAADEGPAEVINRMVACAEQVASIAGAQFDHIMGIGVGAPGPIDIERGVIIEARNLKNFRDVAICTELNSRLQVPVVLNNDANAATFGEWWCGSGRGCEHLCLLTLGTGVGGGVISDGRLVFGSSNGAGELGHMIVQPDGPRCPAGHQGCLEALASATGLIRTAESLSVQHPDSCIAEALRQKSLQVPDLVSAARQGDALANAAWSSACRALGIACVTLEHVLSPQRIVFAGGMAEAGTFLVDEVRKHYHALRWELTPQTCELTCAQLGSMAGAVGAAGLFLHRHKPEAF